jgi:predicted SnoaL-like aldol condensation-catalyzing enzyme
MCCVKVVRRVSEEDLVFVVLPKNPKEKKATRILSTSRRFNK